MGLLDYLTSHALDEDYAFVSRAPTQQAGDAGELVELRRPTSRSAWSAPS